MPDSDSGYARFAAKKAPFRSAMGRRFGVPPLGGEVTPNRLKPGLQTQKVAAPRDCALPIADFT
jgi:hypothetical protein